MNIVSYSIPTIYSTCDIKGNGVVLLSKKKVFKAILLALSVLLTTMQGLEEKEESNSSRFIQEIE